MSTAGWVAIVICVLIVIVDWLLIYICHRIERSQEPPNMCKICGKVIPEKLSLCEDCEREIDSYENTT